MSPTMPVASFPAPMMNAPMPAQNWAAANQAPSAAAQRPQAPPRPKVRAHAPDQPARVEPRPAYLRMPSPEQLGIAQPREHSAAADWAAAHEQFDRLGAVGVQREHLPTGAFRISCLLPTKETERRHYIAVEAISEAEAVQLVLERANDWVRQSRRP